MLEGTYLYFPLITFRLCDCPYGTDTFFFIGPGQAPANPGRDPARERDSARHAFGVRGEREAVWRGGDACEETSGGGKKPVFEPNQSARNGLRRYEGRFWRRPFPRKRNHERWLRVDRKPWSLFHKTRTRHFNSHDPRQFCVCANSHDPVVRVGGGDKGKRGLGAPRARLRRSQVPPFGPGIAKETHGGVAHALPPRG